MTEATNTISWARIKYMNWKKHIENVLQKTEQCMVRSEIHVHGTQ
jgi:hypothetical protein